MRAVELVIFDCDGVLVDSEPLAMRVLLDAMSAQGIEMTREEAFRSFLGRSLASISDSLRDSHGEPLGPAALESMRHDLYALYERELRPVAGLMAALDQLDCGYCVASSSSPERVRVSLSVTGLLERFAPNIFSASMVARGKPAPDLFLFAAEKMGADPSAALVVEDSPAGIRAARAAGMTVFAFTGGGHIPLSGLLPEIEALAPDAIFADMQALPALIDWHVGRSAE